MDERSCKLLLEDHFTDKFELLDFTRQDESSSQFNFNCEIHNEDEENCFLEYYMREINATVKLKNKKKDEKKNIY